MSKTRTRNHHHYPHTEQPQRLELKRRTSLRCDCGKVYAPSRSQAKKLYKAVERATQDQHNVYFYACKFGAWHWTRQALDY